jgi:hypothetical protein
MLKMSVHVCREVLEDSQLGLDLQEADLFLNSRRVYCCKMRPRRTGFEDGPLTAVALLLIIFVFG